MRVAIFSRSLKEESLPIIEGLLETLVNNGASLLVYEPTALQLSSNFTQKFTFAKFTDQATLIDKADVMVSVGGDGTLLDTVSLIQYADLPVLGFNLGRLGYLASVSKQSMQVAVQQLIQGDFSVERRTMVHLTSEEPLFSPPFALNEFTVHKKDTSNMMAIRATLDGKYLNTYWADGLIISTPTGSTGYSLSCGGPIVLAQSGVLIITPIAPHNLNVRPLVIHDSSELTLEVEDRSGAVLVSLDARSTTWEGKGTLTIRRNTHDFPLVRLPGDNPLETLRQKLLWGQDRRNA